VIQGVTEVTVIPEKVKVWLVVALLVLMATITIDVGDELFVSL
jgi:hypothetical protein